MTTAPVPLTYACCVCKRMRTVNGDYIVIVMDTIPNTVISHGYCPACMGDVRKRRSNGKHN